MAVSFKSKNILRDLLLKSIIRDNFLQKQEQTVGLDVNP